MKKVVLLLTLVTGTACAESSVHLQFHGASHHFRERGGNIPWNEKNLGLGIRYQYSSMWGVQAGFFDNSVNRTTVYVVAQFSPIVVNGTSAGIYAGFATGYDEKWKNLLGGFFITQQWDQVSLTVRYVPINRGVLAFEAGVKF